MTAKSYIGAETKDKELPMEVQDINLELYYHLTFAASFGGSAVDDNIVATMGELYSSRMVYLNPLCGVDNGVVADSVQMNVDCSCTSYDLELCLEKVDPIIRQVEYGLDQVLSCYMDKASFVTLHLAINSDTLTEDIARCFAFGINPIQEFYPEEELLKEQLFNYKILQNAKALGYNIQIDYFSTFDICPVLVAKEPIDESVFIEPIIFYEEDEYSETAETNQLTTPNNKGYSTTLNISTWPNNGNGALLASIVKEDYIPWPKTESGAFDVRIEENVMPGGKWSWKQTSDMAHPVLDSVSNVSGWMSLSLAAVGIGACAVGLVVSAPAVAAVAGIALFGATVSGAISTGTAVADGYMYLIDASKEDDMMKSQQASDKARDKFIWEGVSILGGKAAGKGAKYFLNRFKINIKPLNNAIEVKTTEVERMKGRRTVVEGQKNRLQKSKDSMKMENVKKEEKIKVIDQNLSGYKSSKRSKYLREKSQLEDAIEKNSKKTRQKERRLKVINEEIYTLDKEINQGTDTINNLRKMPSDLFDKEVSSGIGIGHSSSDGSSNN